MILEAKEIIKLKNEENKYEFTIALYKCEDLSDVNKKQFTDRIHKIKDRYPMLKHIAFMRWYSNNEIQEIISNIKNYINGVN